MSAKCQKRTSEFSVERPIYAGAAEVRGRDNHQNT
jgi:hypothetical protein